MRKDEPTASPLLPLARTRLALVASIFMVGYLAVSLRLADLTLLRAAPVAEATPMTQEEVKPLDHPLRGLIVDRNGELVATSLKMASVYADATMVENPAELAGQLMQILPGQDRAELVKKLSSGKKFVWLQRDVTPKQEYAINALGNPALNFQEEDRRIYPAGELAAHLVGYTDVDGRGIAGIEKSFDDPLKKDGTTVTLSIDMRVQHILHRALLASVRKFSAKAGMGIVMDVNTGEVIALVSLPDFDPHRPGDAPDDAKFNRATLGVFEPGSTFKMFSTAAALDSGLVHFSSTFDASKPIHYGRFTISDYHAKNRVMTVPEIFMYSSNIGTARMAMEIGPKALRDFYEKMGFFAPLPIEVPEKGQPLYPRQWRDINALTASFGHGIAVSPLHLAAGASALVNGGIAVTPTLLKPEKPGLNPAPKGERVIRPQTSAMIRKLMTLTVIAGTGEKAQVEGYDVGGKTGTAEKNVNGHYIGSSVVSSFLGAFPMENPRYIVLAMLDEPKPIAETHGFVTGGWTAAPVVAEVVGQMGPLYRIPPVEGSAASVAREMSMYLKEKKSLASLGADH